MTSITKELRKAMHHTDGFAYLNNRQFTELCDAIDRKIAEQYIILPLDMDGKPIHFGDVMVMDGDSELREVVSLYDVGFFTWLNGRYVSCAAGLYRHHEHDTWESIIYDAMQAGRTEETVDVTPIIERCKALADTKIKEMS